MALFYIQKNQGTVKVSQTEAAILCDCQSVLLADDYVIDSISTHLKKNVFSAFIARNFHIVMDGIRSYQPKNHIAMASIDG